MRKKVRVFMRKRTFYKIVSALILLSFIMSFSAGVSFMTVSSQSEYSEVSMVTSPEESKFNFNNPVTYDSDSTSSDGSWLPYDYDFVPWLYDNLNAYQKVWEPWITKAAVHAIAFSDDEEFMAIGGGYLLDNEIHIYRWNSEIEDYVKVWDCGDGIIKGDILALDFGDTDNNQFIEVVAASADGHIYVFEQRHIYDPITNTENEFDLVWTSPKMRPVWSLVIEDADLDGKKDIVAVSWDKKIHIFEFDDHSGYPFSQEHWITYKEVWTSEELDDKVYAVAVGDLNYNGLPDIIVGTRNGTIYIFENDGVVLYINGYPFPLTNDNNYYLNTTISGYIWKPISSITVGDLDGDPEDEAVICTVGQGVFVLDYEDSEFKLHKLIKPLETWEMGAGPMGAGHPLDHWVDKMVYGYNVFYVEDSTTYVEPSDDPDRSIAPRNTAMAGSPDGVFSQFNSTTDNESIAIVDFGRHEEATGNGNSEPDLSVTFIGGGGFRTTPDFNNLKFAVSPDNVGFENISSSDLSYTTVSGGFVVQINIDNALNKRQWEYARYLKITVTGGQKYAIDAIKVITLYRPIHTATSATIGTLNINPQREFDKWYTYFYYSYLGYSPEQYMAIAEQLGQARELNKIVIGTVDGRIVAFGYNRTSGNYDFLWDSYSNDYYNLGTNVWFLKEIKRAGKIPTLISTSYKATGYPTMDLIPGETYSHMAILDLDDDGDLDFIIGTKEGRLEFFDTWGTYDEKYTDQIFYYVNSYSAYTNAWLYPTFAYLYTTPESGKPPDLIIGAIDPTTIPSNIGEESANAWIDIWRFDDSLGNYTHYCSLSSIEPFKLSNYILEMSTTVPGTAFADMDGDGDLDLTLVNGRVYYFENVGSATQPKFFARLDYYKDINDKASGVSYRNPQLVDFDKDGDYDLILSYEGKNGATYFVNVGTKDKPKWVEKSNFFSNPSPDGNFAYNNLTDPVFVEPVDYLLEPTYLAAGTNYFMYAFNTYYNSITFMLVDVIYPAHYIIGTNPYIRRMDFALATNGSYPIFGYHIFETWNNAKELEKWTITVETGDLDNDGKNEVIVGDYDNNLYVFEHMVNNTYKRAFRSPDFTHKILTDESPYAWEQLPGVSGNFSRTFWDHVEALIVDCDVDGDGYKEIFAAANLTLYMFEWNGIDDQYTLVWSIDVGSTVWYSLASKNDISLSKITALAYSRDLDYNGKSEIIVGVGPLLLVFECIGDNSFMEVFITDVSDIGRYDLPGNPFTSNETAYYKYLTINSIAVGDTDNDGYQEIILVGTDKRYECYDPDGFAVVLENKVGTYTLAWSAPSNTTLFNKMYIVRIADQDYDGLKEIVIGHDYGVDIWEYINGTDNRYRFVENITSSPAYPRPFMKSLFEFDFDYDLPHPSMDILYTKDNEIFLIYSAYWLDGNVYRLSLFLTRSTDDGKTWTTPQRCFTDASYSSFGRKNSTKEYEPSLTQTSDGKIWLAWMAKTYTTTDQVYYDIYAAIWNGTGWDDIELVYSFTNPPRKSISIWEYTQSGYKVAVSYYHTEYKTAYWIAYDGSSWVHKGALIFDIISGASDYEVSSMDMINIEDGYMLAFAGRFLNEGKVDYDIWVVRANETLDWERPVRVTSATTFEARPSLTVLKTDDKTIMVTFESVDQSGRTKIMVSYSKNNGTRWSEPEELPTMHPLLERYCYYGEPRFLLFGKDYLTVHTYQFKPVIAGRYDGGFVYSVLMNITYYKGIPAVNQSLERPYIAWDILFGLNPSSYWTKFDLKDARALDIGDTDNDGRMEIVVGSDKRVFVFELAHTYSTLQEHTQSWISDELPTKITDLALGDGNGNNWVEIVVSAERGNVYAFEVISTNMTISRLMAPEELWNQKLSDIFQFTYVKFAKIHGTDEANIVAALRNGTIILMDVNGRILKITDISDYVNQIYTYDVNGDAFEDIIIGTLSGGVICLNGRDLTVKWTFKKATDAINSIKILDLYNDKKYVYIVVSSDDKSVYAINLDGSGFWSVNLGYRVAGITTAFYPYTDCRNVIAATLNGTLWIISGEKGIIIDKFTFWDNVEIWDLAAIDLNGDSIEELIIPGKNLVALNSTKGIIWNNTDVSITLSYKIKIADINHDRVNEIIVSYIDTHKLKSELLCVDSLSGKTIWKTTESYGWFWDFNVTGDFNDDGFMDIAVGIYGYYSPMIVYSGKDASIITVYGREGNTICFVDTFDTDHDKKAEILVGGLYGTVSLLDVAEIGKTYRATVGVHEPIVTLDLVRYTPNFAVSGDIDGDGYDELFVSSGYKAVYLIDMPNGEIIADWVSSYDYISALSIYKVGNKTLGVLVGTGASYVVCLCYESGNLKEYWVKETLSGCVVTSIDTGDFDGDGKGEVAVGLKKATSTYGGYVVLLDDDGSALWVNSDPKKSIQEVRAIDYDYNGISEGIVAYALDHAIYYITGSSGVSSWVVNASPYYIASMDIGDVDGNGKAEIVIGMSDGTYGKVSVLDVSGSTVWTQTIDHYVYSVVVGNFSGGDHLDVAVLDNCSYITYLNGTTGDPYQKFISKALFATYQNVVSRSITTIDIDGDGLHEILTLNLRRAYIIDGDNVIWATGEMSSNPVCYTLGNFDGINNVDIAFFTSDKVCYIFSDCRGEIEPLSTPMEQNALPETPKTSSTTTNQTIWILELKLGLMSIFVLSTLVVRKKKQERSTRRQ